MSRKNINDKELYYNPLENQYYIFNDSDKIKCGVYGVPLPKFLPNQTGFKRDSSPVKHKFNLDTNMYRPVTSNFDGYFAFPRPLDKMFINTNLYKNNTTIKEKQVSNKLDDIKSYDNMTKLKDLIYQKYSNVLPKNLNISNKRDIPFLNNKIFHGKLNSLDKRIVISNLEEKIKSNVEDRKNYSLNSIKENKALNCNIKKIKADNKFKLFNITLKEPLEVFKNKFIKVSEQMKNDGHANKQLYLDKFRDKSKDNLVSKEDKLFNYTFSDFMHKKYNKEKLILSKLNMIKISDLKGAFKPINEDNSNNKYNISNSNLLDSKKRPNEDRQNKPNEKIKNELELPGFSLINQESIEINESTESDNFKRLMNKTYSEAGKIESNFSSKADLFVNTFYYEKDKNLMRGIKKNIKKEEGIAHKKFNVKLPPEGELFKRDEQVLKISNPIAYSLNKNREELDLKYLKRKLDASKLKSKNLYGQTSS